jgi:hypothetical protein
MSVEKLNPGDLIRLDSVGELATFEDMVAEQIDSEMTTEMRDAWLARVATKDLIRPPKFNGSMASIGLVVMDEPYAQMLSARERGWAFGSSIGRSGTSKEYVIDSCRGFTLIADALSTGRGVIGQIQAEFWLCEVPRSNSVKIYSLKSGEKRKFVHNYKQTHNYGGLSVRRVITKPKLEVEKFYELQENSRRIGFEVLRTQMMHPIVQPMSK